MAVNAQWCVKFTFRDAKGQTRAITICYAAEGAANANVATSMFSATENVTPALQALSNAHVQCEGNIFPLATGAQSGVVYGTTGEYQSVSQQARLYYLTAYPSGDPANIGTITIPAPVASIFENDLVTVNPLNTNIVALNALLLTSVPVTNGYGACTKSGLQYSTFLGGVLVGKKLSRKWNKFTFDPTLAIRGI